MCVRDFFVCECNLCVCAIFVCACNFSVRACAQFSCTWACTIVVCGRAQFSCVCVCVFCFFCAIDLCIVLQYLFVQVFVNCFLHHVCKMFALSFFAGIFCIFLQIFQFLCSTFMQCVFFFAMCFFVRETRCFSSIAHLSIVSIRKLF